MCESSNHFNSQERVNKWGGENLGWAASFIIAACLTTHFAKANFPDEVKAAKRAFHQTVEVATATIAGMGK